MRTRFTWMLGVAVLISIAVLVACSTTYSSSNNGLVVVSTQGNPDMDTFNLDLVNGSVAQNTTRPPTNGQPTAVVLDPTGTFTYVMITQSSAVNDSVTGIETFPVASDGRLGSGTTTTLKGGVAPVSMIIDSAGKFLFVADSTPPAVSVLAIGSSGGLTEVSGSPFAVTELPGGATRNAIPSPSALAVTSTVYPSAFAVCSGSVPPTTENLYVTDLANYAVLDYSVSSAGALTLVAETATGSNPSGVTVDPCNRFVYVSNSQPDNTVSAYTVCRVVSLPSCPDANDSLLPVSGSPFAVGNSPGALMMDAYAGFLYVLDRGQNAISSFRVSTTTGSLTALSPTPVTTNSVPTAMAIRSDDTWMFVTNLNSGNLSEYAITAATGALTPHSEVQTDGSPWGVAVK
jgi:6-phosphogluconolactonase (cycloisomerase 2 family)